MDLLGPPQEEIKLLFHDPVKYFSLARDASALRISGRNMNHKAPHLISPYVFAAKSARGAGKYETNMFMLSSYVPFSLLDWL